MIVYYEIFRRVCVYFNDGIGREGMQVYASGATAEITL